MAGVAQASSLLAGLGLAFALATTGAVAGALEDGPERVQALIRQLGSEEFRAREEAEKALKEAGPPAHALVKAALATTDDHDLRLRLLRVLKALALSCETDPDLVAAFAREEAAAQRFDAAAQFYARAVALYREQAAARDDEAGRKEVLEKLKKAEARRQRARQFADALACGGKIMAQGARTYVLMPRQVGGRQSFEYRELPTGDGEW